MVGEADLQYRRAEVDCRPGRVKPVRHQGRHERGAERVGRLSGSSSTATTPRGMRGPISSSSPAGPRAPTRSTDARRRHAFTGTLIEHPYGKEPGRPQFMLIPTTASAPLARRRACRRPDDLPDNHLSYALQWFAFAATLAVIYPCISAAGGDGG